MAAYKAALINEIEKLYKKKKAVVVVVISLLAIILGQLAVTGIRSGFGLKAVTDLPYAVLSIFVYTILPLFTALVTIDVFSGEFNQNTIKVAMSRPITRFKLYTAKISAIAFFVLANLLIVMVLSIVAGLITSSLTLNVLSILKVILSYCVSILPIMVLAMMIVFLSNVLKGSTGVFFLSVLLFIALNALGIVFSRYSNIFIASMFEWYKLWSSNTIPVSKIIREFLIMLGCGTMFFVAGFYLFDKKDL